MSRCDQSGKMAAHQPAMPAAIRTAAIAWPRSCWQYLNARSPYFQASRQWIDVSAMSHIARSPTVPAASDQAAGSKRHRCSSAW